MLPGRERKCEAKEGEMRETGGNTRRKLAEGGTVVPFGTGTLCQITGCGNWAMLRAARNVPHKTQARACSPARAPPAESLGVPNLKKKQTNRFIQDTLVYRREGPTTPMKVGYGGKDTPHPPH